MFPTSSTLNNVQESTIGATNEDKSPVCEQGNSIDSIGVEVDVPSTVVAPTDAVQQSETGTIDRSRMSSATNSTVTTKYRVGHSSSAAKFDHIQVQPSDFKKIKLIGRGDVGRVYLVQNKKDDVLFAMKGS